jgi:hypothetical protein
MFRKSGIAIKTPNASNNVPAVKFMLLISDLEYPVFKRRPPWQFIIDDGIELFDSMK